VRHSVPQCRIFTFPKREVFSVFQITFGDLVKLGHTGSLSFYVVCSCAHLTSQCMLPIVCVCIVCIKVNICPQWESSKNMKMAQLGTWHILVALSIPVELKLIPPSWEFMS
jgi:hypothetical protein